MSTIEIIPTVVPASWDDVVQTAKRYPFAKARHVDFADGIFAPNTTWLPEVNGIYKIDGITLEAHLMVKEPKAAGESLASGGFERLIGHVEAISDIGETFARWKAAGAREVGLGMLYQTAIEAIDRYVAQCDAVQMMSIASIGVQGIPYESEAPRRIAALHERYPELLIADDGGVGERNIEALAQAGVRRFCVGSALSKAMDPETMYKRLLSLVESAV